MASLMLTHCTDSSVQIEATEGLNLMDFPRVLFITPSIDSDT